MTAAGPVFTPDEIPFEDGLRRAGHARLADAVSASFGRCASRRDSRRTSTR